MRYTLLLFLSMVILYPSLAQWSRSGDLDGRMVNEFLVKDSLLFVGTDGGVFRSTDNGSTWTQLNNGLTDTMIVALAAADTLIFAGSWVEGVYQSSDNGLTWTRVTQGMTDTFISDLLISGPHIFAGTEDGGGIFRRLITGTTWAEITSGLFGHDGIVLSSFVNSTADTTIYLGDDNSIIFRSTNKGIEWEHALPSFPEAGIGALITVPHNNSAFLLAGTYRGILRSAVTDTMWIQKNNGLMDTMVYSLTTASDDSGGITLFAGTENGGVYQSIDFGETWSSLDSGFSTLRINALTIAQGYIFAGLDSGVWKRSLSQVVTSARSVRIEVPTEFILEQNYPNPFNPSTVISYQLPVNSHITLKVYDVIGREVATLVNEVKEAGRYSTQFDGTKLSSGIYVARLQSGGKVQLKKMLLLK